MKDPQAVAEILEKAFTRIHLEQMQGIPILNSAIRIEAVGFQLVEGRVVGVLITPWLMSVVMLPRDDEDWTQLALGQKQPHKFPSRIYKFMVNDIDDIGVCQMHSLHSPMRAFSSHEQALVVAQAFLHELMIEREPSEEDLVDEELLGKIMRGEATPETEIANFSPVDTSAISLTNEAPATEQFTATKVSRRNLLRGKLQDNA